MLRIVFTSEHFDRDRNEWAADLLAEYELNGPDLRRVAGDGPLHPETLKLLAPGERLLTIKDGEEWGKLLPQAYPRLNVEVTEVAATTTDGPARRKQPALAER